MLSSPSIYYKSIHPSSPTFSYVNPNFLWKWKESKQTPYVCFHMHTYKMYLWNDYPKNNFKIFSTAWQFRGMLKPLDVKTCCSSSQNQKQCMYTNDLKQKSSTTLHQPRFWRKALNSYDIYIERETKKPAQYI